MLKKLEVLLANTQDILPSDRVIIEGLREGGGTTLNEDILSRIFKNARIESLAINRVASDIGRMCAEQKNKSNGLEIFNECFKKIAAVVMSKP